MVVKVNRFRENSELDVTSKIDKKQNFDYLPWAAAWEFMKNIDDSSTYEVEWFEHYRVVSGQHEDFLVKEEHPYQVTPKGSYVVVTVVLNGSRESEIHAITDYKNADVFEPSMTQVNKSIKRAFVKALAKHGIGLFVYMGEDVPAIPRVSIKELDKLDVLIEKLLGLMGDNEEKDSVVKGLIARTNKVIKQDYNYLSPIKKVHEMNTDQLGLMYQIVGQGIQSLENNKKK